MGFKPVSLSEEASILFVEMLTKRLVVQDRTCYHDNINEYC